VEGRGEGPLRKGELTEKKKYFAKPTAATSSRGILQEPPRPNLRRTIPDKANQNQEGEETSYPLVAATYDT